MTKNLFLNFRSNILIFSQLTSNFNYPFQISTLKYCTIFDQFFFLLLELLNILVLFKIKLQLFANYERAKDNIRNNCINSKHCSCNV